ncbi:MAG: outer membrane beta-barrel protein [Methylococcaceae bacterium]
MSLLSCGNALAYDSNDDSDITRERQISDYAQQGIHAGAFTILPKLDFTNQYMSNIYYRDKALGPTSDSYVAHFKPGVKANSNWNQHALNFKLDTDLALYATQPNNNDYNNVFTKLDGRLDVLHNSHFDTAFAYNYLTESRGSPDQINGGAPTIYDTKVIDGFYTHTLNRVTAKAGLNAIRYDYQNVQSSINNTTLQMNTRNHWLYTPELRLGYLIQPEYEAFVKFQYLDASYDTLTLTNGSGRGTAYNRNSWGYNALGGIAFDVTGLITGDASIGYLQRSYEDARLSEISGVNGFINLRWRPTKLTTVNGKVSRVINETTQQGVAGVFTTGVGVSVQHELMRNIYLNVAGDYSNGIYKGYVAPNTENRNDNTYIISTGAKYLLNKNFSTDLTYTFQNRSTNYQFANYDLNLVMVNFRAQF